MMSYTTLGLVIVVLIYLTINKPFYYLLIFDLLLVGITPGNWQLGSMLFDGSDLVMACIVLSLMIRGRPAGGPPKIPYLGLWILLGVMLSLSYIVSPLNAEYMTDPARIAYQLYRYAWKPILFYPFAALFLSEPRQTRATAFAVIAGGVLCAFWSIPQGYAGLRAYGSLDSPNTLGAVLVVPLVFTFVMLIVNAGTARRKALFGACILVLLRGLTFSGSRGALAASLFGIVAASALLSRVPAMRPALIRIFAPIAFAVLIAMMIPGLLANRPSLDRFSGLSAGTNAETFQWRMENRWPHFLAIAADNPILGTGTYVDWSLGTSGNTPHNGFISVAVKNGFPVLVIYLTFSLLGIWHSLRLVGTALPNPWGPVAGALAAAAILSLLLHNVTETNFEIGSLGKVLWAYIALASVAGQAISRGPARPPVLQPAPRPPRMLSTETGSSQPG
jgi:hypothetical protein